MALLSHVAPVSTKLNGTHKPATYTAQPGPSVPPHPLGIKPLGNKYLASGPNARECAGTFQVLPDEILAVFLEYLDQTSLRRLGYTCKFLFAFCSSDDLWKTIFLE